MGNEALRILIFQISNSHKVAIYADVILEGHSATILQDLTNSIYPENSRNAQSSNNISKYPMSLSK